MTKRRRRGYNLEQFANRYAIDRLANKISQKFYRRV